MLIEKTIIEDNKEFLKVLEIKLPLASLNHQGKVVRLNTPAKGDDETLIVPNRGLIQVWSRIGTGWSWPTISEFDTRTDGIKKQIEAGLFEWVDLPE